MYFFFQNRARLVNNEVVKDVTYIYMDSVIVFNNTKWYQIHKGCHSIDVIFQPGVL